jgi:hypothetical protein
VAAVEVVVKAQALQPRLVALVVVEMVVFIFHPLLNQQQAQSILVAVEEEPLAIMVAPLEVLVLF